MENLSHTRNPNRSIPSSLPKKPGGGLSYNSTKATYDDVFGGPPRFGAPTLSPRLEDYCEIFAGFYGSSRAAVSSIPVLDLPLVDDRDVYFDVKSQGFDYREVFGGFNDLDFAPSYEELFSQRSNVVADCDSSDGAWTPEEEEVESFSGGGTEHSKSPCRDSYDSIDGCTEFNISYNKASQRSENNIRVADLGAIRGYTVAVDEMVSVEKETGPSSVGRYGFEDKEPFVTVSEIGLKTNPTGIPPPSRPPPVMRSEFRSSGSNSRTTGSEGSGEGSSPPFFDVEVDASSAAVRDAMVNAEAKLKSAKECFERRRDGARTTTKGTSMNNTAALPIDVAKKIPRDKHGSKSLSSQGSANSNDEWEEDAQFVDLVRTEQPRNADENSGGKDVPLDGGFFDQKLTWAANVEWEKQQRKAKGDRVDLETKKLPKHHGTRRVPPRHKRHEERLADKTPGDVMDEKSRHVELQCETGNGLRDNDGIVKQRNMRRPEENKLLTEKLAMQKEELLCEEKTKQTQNQESDRRPQRKAAEKNRDSVFNWEQNARKLREALGLAENESTLEVSLEPNGNGKVLGIRDAPNESETKLNEALKRMEEETRIKEARVKEENDRREALEKAENEKRLKVALEQEERERRLKEAREKVENERKLVEARAREKAKYERRMKEQEEDELQLKEAFEKEEKDRRMREAREKAEHERKMKEQEKERKIQEAREKAENKRRIKEAREKAELEQRLKEIREQEEKENDRIKEGRVKEENDRREREAFEMAENEKRLKAALEQEEREKRLKEAREKEENERKLAEARAREKAEQERRMKEQEEYELGLKEAFEKEEKNRRMIEARERKMKAALEQEKERKIQEAREKEENERRIKEAREKAELEQRLKEIREQEEKERRIKEIKEKEENERRAKEVLERAENERKLKEAVEQERRVKEAREKEENEKKLKEAIELEEKEKRLLEAFEKAETERRLKEDLEQEKKERENEVKEHESAREESDKRQRDACEMEKTCETTKEGHGKQSSKESSIDTLDEVEDGPGQEESRDMSDEACPWKIFEKNLKNASQKDGAVELDTEIKGHNQQNGESSEQSASVMNNNIQEGKFEQNSKTFENSKDASVLKQDVGMKTEVEEKSEGVVVKENVRKVGAGLDQRNLEESKCGPRTSSGIRNHDPKLERPLPSRVFELREKEAERLKREREIEMERLRKIEEEEEREREREREKDRMAFDQRALADARERLEKACAEAREKSLPDKVLMEARFRAERAAVERATTEARERAAEKAAFEARERMERSVSEKQFHTSGFFGERDKHFQTSASFGASRFQSSPGTDGESPQRYTSRLERHRRTADRVAKALAEKNMRDLVAQREQAERIRISESLDAEVKRWSSGKEGNIRALLSTLQYILGPESGWQPLPLTEVITSAAVKRAYRKATLCVHPDKLQQRGANIHQKYICEKVFDLLKEAWNRFNSEER